MHETAGNHEPRGSSPSPAEYHIFRMYDLAVIFSPKSFICVCYTHVYWVWVNIIWQVRTFHSQELLCVEQFNRCLQMIRVSQFHLLFDDGCSMHHCLLKSGHLGAPESYGRLGSTLWVKWTTATILYKQCMVWGTRSHACLQDSAKERFERPISAISRDRMDLDYYSVSPLIPSSINTYLNARIAQG